MKIAKALLEAEAHVSVFDPLVKKISPAGLEMLECANSSPPVCPLRMLRRRSPREQFKALTSDDLITHMAQPCGRCSTDFEEQLAASWSSAP